MRRYLRQVSAEQRVYWRNGASAFFTFFLPILFLVFLGLFGRDRIVDGRPYADFFVPGHARDGGRDDDLRRPRDHARDPARARAC